MQRQSNDEPGRLPFVDERPDRREVPVARLLSDRRQRMRDSRPGLADGNADPLGAEIECENAARIGCGGHCRRCHASRVPDGVGQP